MKLLDLTLEITPDMPMFPGSQQPAIMPQTVIAEYGYSFEILFLNSHTGTHMDAPFHFVEDGLRMHQISTEKFSGRAALIDVKAAAGTSIDTADIRQYEKTWGIIPDNTPVIFRTGWQSHLNQEDYFTRNPGLSPDAAKYLASKNISLVGTDAPSIDTGSDDTFPAHRVLAQAGAVNVEALAHLDQIKTHTLDFIILPMNIRGATGAPVRAMAIL